VKLIGNDSSALNNAGLAKVWLTSILISAIVKPPSADILALLL